MPTRKNKTRANGRRKKAPTRLLDVLDELDYEAMSPMGRELVRLSAEYERSGQRLLSTEEILQEIARRRGGAPHAT